MTSHTFEEEQAEAKKEQAEDHPFMVPQKPDMAGADQNQEGDPKTKDQQSARNKAKSGN